MGDEEKRAVKCSECNNDTAFTAWIQIFGSLGMARSPGDNTVISGFLPGPGGLKVEVCLRCKVFRPSLAYTSKETKELEEYAREQVERLARGNNVAKVLKEIVG